MTDGHRVPVTDDQDRRRPPGLSVPKLAIELLWFPSERAVAAVPAIAVAFDRLDELGPVAWAAPGTPVDERLRLDGSVAPILKGWSSGWRSGERNGLDLFGPPLPGGTAGDSHLMRGSITAPLGWVGHRARPGPPIPGHLTASWTGPHVTEQVVIDRVADFFVALADASGAFYGKATGLEAQLAATKRGGKPQIDRQFQDVFWLNLFGPAMVDRWGGPGVFAEDGLPRRHATRDRAVIVGSAPGPFDHDAILSDDGWREPFFATAGRAAFGGAPKPVPGSLLPDLFEQHERSPWRGPSPEEQD